MLITLPMRTKNCGHSEPDSNLNSIGPALDGWFNSFCRRQPGANVIKQILQ